MLRRILVVALDEPDLYDYICRDHFGDETVSVITDRRRANRRRRQESYVTDRRREDRRRFDIEPRLRTQGWAEVRLSGS